MRYYNFALYASTDQIKEKTTITLREYAYENTIAAVNNYMYRRLDNDVSFFAYREEGNTTFAVFSYDEKKGAFVDAFAHITGVLKEDFSVNRIKSDPYEITMYQALDFLLEARRDFMNLTNRFIETSNLWIYNCYNNETKSFHFEFRERIVPEKSICKSAIYDQAFTDELINIEEHENASDFKGNMVHYVISGRSVEAVKDITETLMQSLIKARRISSRRMEVISEIEPDVYRIENHLNKIIEGNYGGVIVLIGVPEKEQSKELDLLADSIIWRLSIWCVQMGHSFESGDVGYVHGFDSVLEEVLQKPEHICTITS